MNSKERILSVLNGQAPDYIPLTTWCFGFRPPKEVTWSRDGVTRTFWYSNRMEFLHTLTNPWSLEDDFDRVTAWKGLGVDDVLEISIPWGMHPDVTFTDTSDSGSRKRSYSTPVGELTHNVRHTSEEIPDGWVKQPDDLPLFEDFNIPRAVEHAVSSPDDVEKIAYLYRGPGEEEAAWLEERMEKVKPFADEAGVPVQAWSAFGMDAVIWLMGTENAVYFALDYPVEFERLLDIITEADVARTDLAAKTDGVDIVVERGWYSSTDFWSPSLFDKFLSKRIELVAQTAHHHGKKLGYVMTTGVDDLGDRLLKAGVDMLYFYDPFQDAPGTDSILELAKNGMTVVGGTNALSILPENESRLEDEVKRSIDLLGPTNRFILHPVDALFPDTPTEGLLNLIQLWQKHR